MVPFCGRGAKVVTMVADDILRARLQTVGVEEHRLVMETGEPRFISFSPSCLANLCLAAAENGQQWIFYDVGGARGQRGTSLTATTS